MSAQVKGKNTKSNRKSEMLTSDNSWWIKWRIADPNEDDNISLKFHVKVYIYDDTDLHYRVLTMVDLFHFPNINHLFPVNSNRDFLYLFNLPKVVIQINQDWSDPIHLWLVIYYCVCFIEVELWGWRVWSIMHI